MSLAVVTGLVLTALLTTTVRSGEIEKCLTQLYFNQSHALPTNGVYVHIPLTMWSRCVTLGAPLNNTERESLVAMVRTALTLYCFKDYVQIRKGIDLDRVLDVFSHSQQSLTDSTMFHSFLARMLMDISDPHFSYVPPYPLASTFIVRPYLLTLGHGSGGSDPTTFQVEYSDVPSWWDAAVEATTYFGVPLGTPPRAPFRNRSIVKRINKIDATTWATNMAKPFLVDGAVGSLNMAAVYNFHVLAITDEALMTGGSANADGALSYDTFEMENGETFQVSRIVVMPWTNSPSKKKKTTSFHELSQHPINEWMPTTHPYHPRNKNKMNPTAFTTGGGDEVLIAQDDFMTCSWRGDDVMWLQFTTFSVGDANTASAVYARTHSAIQTLRRCLNNSADRILVLDLRMNPGGNVVLMRSLEMVLTSRIIPQQAFMKDVDIWGSVLDFRADASALVGNAGFVHLYFNITGNLTSGQLNSKYWELAQSTSAPSNRRAEKYFRTYFYPNASEYSESPWGYKEVIIVTDGVCASSCAQFEMRMRTFFGAKAVGVGGATNLWMQSSSRPGGIAYSYSQIAAYYSARLFPSDLVQLPPPMLVGADVRFGIEAWYLQGNDTVPRDWLPLAPDKRVLMWPPINENSLTGELRSYVRSLREQRSKSYVNASSTIVAGGGALLFGSVTSRFVLLLIIFHVLM